MKYAVISDIHGNLEACRAVFDDLARQKPDRILCLGDIVGYGADPQSCVELVRGTAAVCVAGNHDWGAAGKIDFTNFNRAAQAALQWTASRLSPAQVQCLADLPLSAEESFFLITHATPSNPHEWRYIFTHYDAFLNLTALEHPLCFVGHSHLPMLFSLNPAGEVAYGTAFDTIALDERCRYIINVGSVGQPRDGNPNAAYGILDTETRTFSLRRVPYDVAAAQRKIVAAGLPPFLAERLSMGW